LFWGLHAVSVTTIHQGEKHSAVTKRRKKLKGTLCFRETTLVLTQPTLPNSLLDGSLLFICTFSKMLVEWLACASMCSVAPIELRYAAC